MDFRILGPLEVVEGDHPLAVPGIKERSVLAILLLHANELVSADRLIDDLWSDEPPATARKSLQVRVANLRKALGQAGELLRTQSPGYVLKLEPDQLDLLRFERLVAAAGDMEPSAAAATLREALALWRGTPLADLAYEEFAQGPIARLDEVRLAAIEKRVDVELSLGRHADLVRELEQLVTRHPLRERLRGQLMLTLYRSGRQADALAVYRETRRVLDEELGLEPGPALQRLERAVLAQDPALELESATREPPTVAPTGTVTFLFTDIEGSSQLVLDLAERYGELLSAQRRLVREICRGRKGHEVDVQGDACFFAFGRVLDALESAVAVQQALGTQRWPASAEVRIRIGIHTGTPSLSTDGYYGVDVIRGVRVCAAAHGEQVLISDATRALIPIDHLDHYRLVDLGEHSLRGLDRTERLFQIAVHGMREDFPPPRSADVMTDLGRPTTAAIRSILVVSRDLEHVEGLVAIAEPIGVRSSREVILLHFVSNEEGLPAAAESIHRWRAELLARGLAARAAAFTSVAPAEDVVRTVAEQDVDLLVLDAPPDLLEDEALASTLARAACDVAVLAGGGGRVFSPGPVLVPFGGAEHDWAAVELAAQISGSDERLLLVGLSGKQSGRGRDASRLLASASLAIQRALGVAAEPLLVPPGSEGLVRAADEAALVVVGLSDRWQKDGLGPVRRAVVTGARPPVLLVRRGLRPGVLAPPESVTRFTWTVRAG